MKSILTLAALLALTVSTTANAASLSVSTGANKTFSVWIDGEADNGNFNTVKLEVNAIPNSEGVPSTLLGLSSGAGKVVGDVGTFRNRMLDADPLDGGLGWSTAGVQTSASVLGFSGGPLGGNITTADQPSGRLWLGNFQLSTPGVATVLVQLSNSTGDLLFDQTVTIPEPATLAMASCSLIGLLALRRRRS